MSTRTARFVLLIAPSGTCYIQGPTLDSYFGVLFIDGFEMARRDGRETQAIRARNASDPAWIACVFVAVVQLAPAIRERFESVLRAFR